MSEWKWLIFWSGVFVVVMAMAVSCENRKKERCEAKGGEYHSQYKSNGLCLPKGSTIQIDD